VAVGRERAVTVGGDQTNCFTMSPTHRSEIPASTTLATSKRFGISS
jgi:hypothetical protein